MEAMSLLDVEIVVLGVEARPHKPILFRAHICKIIAIVSCEDVTLCKIYTVGYVHRLW